MMGKVSKLSEVVNGSVHMFLSFKFKWKTRSSKQVFCKINIVTSQYKPINSSNNTMN